MLYKQIAPLLKPFAVTRVLASKPVRKTVTTL